MKDTVRTYISYVKVFFKTKSEYKVGFVLGIIANFYTYLLSFLSFGIIINKFKSIAGWNFENMSILYGLNLFSYAVAGMLVWYNVFQVEKDIVSGKLDLYLTRPMSVLGQLICSRFGDTFLGQIIVTFMFLINGLYKTESILSIKMLVYLICTMIGGIALQIGAMILFGSLSFWTMRSERIAEIFYYQLRSITYYPLSIYPKWIKILLTAIFPWAFINYYPALIILNKAVTKIEYFCGIFAPIIGIVFLITSIMIFNKGLSKYTSTGT